MSAGLELMTMNLLAIDTCDARGSVAVLRNEETRSVTVYEGQEEYSSWLLTAVYRSLEAAGLSLPEVDVFAVATGPGSFTGARIGLTAIKAWAEICQRKIAGISRLEALASQAAPDTEYVAAFFDGSRNQVFGALYRRRAAEFDRVGDELVLSPSEFIAWVGAESGSQPVRWAALDPEKVTGESAWSARADRGEEIFRVPSNLAPLIGKIGYGRALAGNLVDALALAANYVRRTDAEVFWSGGPPGAVRPK